MRNRVGADKYRAQTSPVTYARIDRIGVRSRLDQGRNNSGRPRRRETRVRLQLHVPRRPVQRQSGPAHPALRLNRAARVQSKSLQRHRFARTHFQRQPVSAQAPRQRPAGNPDSGPHPRSRAIRRRSDTRSCPPASRSSQKYRPARIESARALRPRNSSADIAWSLVWFPNEISGCFAKSFNSAGVNGRSRSLTGFSAASPNSFFNCVSASDGLQALQIGEQAVDFFLRRAALVRLASRRIPPEGLAFFHMASSK